jgi:hypothetical protein
MIIHAICVLAHRRGSSARVQLQQPFFTEFIFRHQDLNKNHLLVPSAGFTNGLTVKELFVA